MRSDRGESVKSLTLAFTDGFNGKALIRWSCVLERDGLRRSWRGLDVLHFEDGLVKEKHTYAKATVPLLDEAS